MANVGTHQVDYPAVWAQAVLGTLVQKDCSTLASKGLQVTGASALGTLSWQCLLAVVSKRYSLIQSADILSAMRQGVQWS